MDPDLVQHSQEPRPRDLDISLRIPRNQDGVSGIPRDLDLVLTLGFLGT